MVTSSKWPNRRSIRLPQYEYASVGVYFVTICTHQRETNLGEVKDGKVLLSDAGEIVEHIWKRLTWFFKSIELDAFCIMPNHVHGIIVIERAMQRAVSKSSLGEEAAALPLQFGSPPQSIPAIVQNLKSVSAKKINLLRQTPGAPVWQRNYYEHVVRMSQGQQELQTIRKYIDDNPLKWELDSENPSYIAKPRGN